MGHWRDNFGRFPEDSKILRLLRTTGDWEVHDHDDRGEALYWVLDEIRSESLGKLEQLIRNRGVQMQSFSCDSARWRSLEDRRQHLAEFHRGAGRNQDERKIQAQLRRACERAIVHGHQQAGKDLRCEIGYYSSTDRYSSNGRIDPSKPVQYFDVPDRFRIRSDSISMFAGVSIAWEELLQFIPPDRNAASD